MTLQDQIDLLQADLDRLSSQLKQERAARQPNSLPLALHEYRRYGRQMILPGFGLGAQLKLKNSRVLVVGAGGLGCPALLYLASAGIGHIAVTDHDTVELSNLHRQVLHTERTIGNAKVLSAVKAIQERNPTVEVRPIHESLSPSVLLSPELDFASFDLVLDCSDNAPTRYLINDACVAYKKVLVSGAAIRLEGQLAIWNLPPMSESQERGPCYRCVFPEAGAAQTSQNCEDEGVLGTVTGTIGTLMAGEAIKLLTGLHSHEPRLTLYSWADATPFRTLKVKGSKGTCSACVLSGAQRLLEEHLEQEKNGDWTARICGIGENVPLGPARISPRELAGFDPSATLLDVRTKEAFSICSLPGFQNIPLVDLMRHPDTSSKLKEPVVVVCQRGNDSVAAVAALQEAGISAKDVQGGLRRYTAEVDPSFPVY